MTINVTFESIEEMKGFAAAMAGTAEPIKVEVTPVVRKGKPAKEEPAVEEEAIKEETTVTEEPTFKLEDVRARLAELSKAGKRAAVQDLIKSFGVDKLTLIDPAKFGEVMKKAEEI